MAGSRKRTSRSKKPMKRTTQGSCKRGYVKKSGYVRKSYVRRSGKRVKSVRVKASCIKSRGSGHGLKLGVKVKKGALTQYGYDSYSSAVSRHRALAKAVSHTTPLKVFKQINYLVVVNKSRPSLEKIYKADRNWLKAKYMED